MRSSWPALRLDWIHPHYQPFVPHHRHTQALSSAYTFVLVGRSVEATKARSFKEVRSIDAPTR